MLLIGLYDLLDAHMLIKLTSCPSQFTQQLKAKVVRSICDKTKRLCSVVFKTLFSEFPEYVNACIGGFN